MWNNDKFKPSNFKNRTLSILYTQLRKPPVKVYQEEIPKRNLRPDEKASKMHGGQKETKRGHQE